MSDRSSPNCSIGLEMLICVGKRVHRVTLDYALGTAILGILPLYGQGIPAMRLILLSMLNLKMLWDIRAMWGHPRKRAIFSILSLLVAIIRSLGLGILVWVLILAIGFVVPGLDSVARAVSYGVMTWSLGLAGTRYFSNPQNLDLGALHRVSQNSKYPN